MVVDDSWMDGPKCHTCDKRFETQNALQRHIKLVHFIWKDGKWVKAETDKAYVMF